MQTEAIHKMPEQNLRNEIKTEFTKFIQQFRDNNGEYKYEQAAKGAITSGRHHIMFSFKDLLHHNSELSSIIFADYYKYESIINEALTQYMHEY
jgi:DNA replicative helicase MCM subunit Mcm2 (Cdc46/Mcm family)